MAMFLSPHSSAIMFCLTLSPEPWSWPSMDWELWNQCFSFILLGMAICKRNHSHTSILLQRSWEVQMKNEASLQRKMQALQKNELLWKWTWCPQMPHALSFGKEGKTCTQEDSDWRGSQGSSGSAISIGGKISSTCCSICWSPRRTRLWTGMWESCEKAAGSAKDYLGIGDLQELWGWTR